jgi:hypothetical protein
MFTFFVAIGHNNIRFLEALSKSKKEMVTTDQHKEKKARRSRVPHTRTPYEFDSY